MKNLSIENSFARYCSQPAAIVVIIFSGIALISSCSGAGNEPGNLNSANVNAVIVNSSAGKTGDSALAVNSAQPAANSSATNNSASDSDAANTNRNGTIEATAATADDPDMPSESELQTLVKTTLLDFNSAIQSGSFDSFQSSASADFQQQFTPAQLEQKYGEFIGKKFDFSQIANKQATLTPRLETESGSKILKADGFYPTNPTVGFELRYIQEDIEWKLLGIEIKTN